MSVKPNSGRKLRQENQEFIVVLSYTKSWRPAWLVGDLVSRKNKTKNFLLPATLRPSFAAT